MYSALFNLLDTLKPVNEHDRALFSSCLTVKTTPKQTILLGEGEISNDLFFIVKGSIRAYQLKDGDLLHHAFFFENTFASDFESLTLQKASQSYLETLEPTDIICLNRAKMIELYKEAPVFESIGRIILERFIVQQQRYGKLFTLYSPAERYAYILEHHPELLQRIPLQFLASYLGVTRETLSRIRRRSIDLL